MTDTLTGIVADLPEEAYFASPALSSSGARDILRTPAYFRYRQEHPEPARKEFDVGSAVHAKVLGVGAPIVTIPDDILASNGAISTKEAKEFVERARRDGLIPVKETVADEIHSMTEAVLGHPAARALLEQSGMAEASLFGTDPDTGVAMRARFDWLPDFTVDNPCTVDLKSARDASPNGFAKAVAEHRYDIQQEWYLLLYAILTGEFTMPMQFIAVEKEPPYLVGVYPLATEFAEMGRRKVRQALEIYAACSAADLWPGYPTNAEPLQPPTWLMFSEGAIA